MGHRLYRMNWAYPDFLLLHLLWNWNALTDFERRSDFGSSDKALHILGGNQTVKK